METEEILVENNSQVVNKESKFLFFQKCWLEKRETWLGGGCYPAGNSGLSQHCIEMKVSNANG